MKHIPRYTAPTKLPSFVAVCFCALTLAFTQHPALAQSWSGATNSAWGDEDNWSPTGVPATNAALTFGTASGYTVDLGGVSREVGNLTFTNGASYTLQNGTLTLASGAGINTTAAGTTTINANLTLSGTTTISGNATINGLITTSGTLNVASVGQIVTISGSAQNAITGSFAILGGTVYVDKSAGTTLAQQRAIGNNLIFANSPGTLIYQNQAGSLGRIVLQRDGTIEAAEGFSVTGTGTGNYIRFRPGYKLTLNTYANTANIETWVELDGGFSVKTGSIELETLSNVNFNQVDRGIRDNSPGGDGVLSLIKSGAGTLTYASTVTNSYTGSTTLKDGTLSMGNIAQLGGSGNDATNLVLSGGTLEYTGASVTSGRGFTVGSGTNTIAVTNASSTLEFSGTLTGAGELRKTGAGTLALSGNGSSRSGKTLVSAGTLLLDGSLGGETQVGAGGIISGGGTVNALTISEGGTLSPGNSPGTLYATGGATLSAGGNYNWQIHDATGNAGEGYDTFAITGTLDLTGLETSNKFAINLWSLSDVSPDVDGAALNFNSAVSQSWVLASASSGINITGLTNPLSDYFAVYTGANNGTAGFANDLGGGEFSVVAGGNDLYLNFSPVPEPSSATLFVLGCAAAFLMWRKKMAGRSA